MLKIFQARLQQYMNQELPIPEKNIYVCFIDYAKALTVWITTNCGKFLKRWEYQTTFFAF